MDVDVKRRCTVCGTDKLDAAQLTEAQEAARKNVPDVLPYEACSRCGLWLQFPPPPFQYEADDKDGHMKAVVLSESRQFERLANNLVTGYKPNSVLDIGPSYPLMLKMMKDRGVPSVLGIDGSPYALDYGKELDVPLVQGDFLKYDFGKQKFDLISMVHVIEHFHEPFPALLKMKSLLNHNGVIFLRTPLNDTEGLTRWHLTKYHFQVHPIIFSQRSLKMMCELGGLELIHEAVGHGIGHGDYVFRLR